MPSTAAPDCIPSNGGSSNTEAQVCNLCAVTKGQQAIRDLTRAMIDRTGACRPCPGSSPTMERPSCGGASGPRAELARWGMRSPLFALKGKKTDAGVTNVHRVQLPIGGDG
jgi:hypothetical protein